MYNVSTVSSFKQPVTSFSKLVTPALERGVVMKVFSIAIAASLLFLSACGGGVEEAQQPAQAAVEQKVAAAPVVVVASAPQPEPAPTFVPSSVVGGGVGGMCGAIRSCGAGEPSATITWNAEKDGTCGTPPLTVSACPVPKGH